MFFFWTKNIFFFQLLLPEEQDPPPEEEDLLLPEEEYLLLPEEEDLRLLEEEDLLLGVIPTLFQRYTNGQTLFRRCSDVIPPLCRRYSDVDSTMGTFHKRPYNMLSSVASRKWQRLLTIN